MTWETFKRPDVPRALWLTIMKSGNALSFSTKAWESIGKPVSVVLLFDRDQHVLGMRASADGEEGFKVTVIGKSSCVVAPKGLGDHFGIKPSEAVRRPAYVLDGVLCVDLKLPGTVVSKPRADHRIARVPDVAPPPTITA